VRTLEVHENRTCTCQQPENGVSGLSWRISHWVLTLSNWSLNLFLPHMQLWRGQEVDVNDGKLLWSMVFSGYFCPLQSMSGVYKLEADLYPFQSFILLSFGVKNCLMQVTGISVLSRQVRFCSAWITAHYLSNTRL